VVARPRCQRYHRPPIDVQLVSTIGPAITANTAGAAIRLRLVESPGFADNFCPRVQNRAEP